MPGESRKINPNGEFRPRDVQTPASKCRIPFHQVGALGNAPVARNSASRTGYSVGFGVCRSDRQDRFQRVLADFSLTGSTRANIAFDYRIRLQRDTIPAKFRLRRFCLTRLPSFPMLTRSRKRFSAWLGLTAMCLALCVPVVSQWLAAHRDSVSQIDATLCTVAGLTQSLAPTVASSDSRATSHHSQAADHGDACGYCSLLANHPPLVTPPHASAVAFVWIARAGPAAVATVQTRSLAYTPPVRAPPFVS